MIYLHFCLCLTNQDGIALGLNKDMVGYYLQLRNKLGTFGIRLEGARSGGDVFFSCSVFTASAR